MTEVHLFEPTGYAGIFQHTCQLAMDLSANPNCKVVVHTARQHENVPTDGIKLCTCSWWPHRTDDRLIPKISKQIAIIASLLLITLPHLCKSMSRGAVFHLQGPGASNGINAVILWAARHRGCRAIYSPHDSFSRRGRLDSKLRALSYRSPHAIIVFSEADRDRLNNYRPLVYVSPLIQLITKPQQHLVQRWRQEWSEQGSDNTVVLCAGFIRPDKRLDLLIESARSWPAGRRLAVVGEDRGHWQKCAQLADDSKVSVRSHIGFVSLDEFAAAIKAADLVVVPAEQASQSGVLSLACQLGTPSVAADTGGMAELASRTFRPGDVSDLTSAINAELNEPPLTSRPSPSNELAVDCHLRAYGLNDRRAITDDRAVYQSNDKTRNSKITPKPDEPTTTRK